MRQKIDLYYKWLGSWVKIKFLFSIFYVCSFLFFLFVFFFFVAVNCDCRLETGTKYWLLQFYLCVALLERNTLFSRVSQEIRGIGFSYSLPVEGTQTESR